MATRRQKLVAQKVLENPGKSVSAAMREAGYSEASSKNPQDLTRSKTWEQLMEQYLPDKKLAETHNKLLGAKYLDHMVFPLATEESEIRKLINSVGGTVKKIQFGDTAIHVWFWAANTKAQKDAVELAYKLKGRLKEVKDVNLRKIGDVLDELDELDQASQRDELGDEAEQHLKQSGVDIGRPEAS